MRKFILIFFMVLMPAVCCAQEKQAWEDVLIGSSFKTLAKAFVATADIKKIKRANIEKLDRMDDEKFKKRYLKAYDVVKDLPPDFKKTYGISEAMSKEQAIKNLKILDKNKIYELIDAVPNKTISRQFKDYMLIYQDEFEGLDLRGKIQKFWNFIRNKSGFVET